MTAHILVADDDLLLCEVVRFKLGALGHQIRFAHDGLAAVAAVRAERPDLVILDSMARA